MTFPVDWALRTNYLSILTNHDTVNQDAYIPTWEGTRSKVCEQANKQSNAGECVDTQGYTNAINTGKLDANTKKMWMRRHKTRTLLDVVVLRQKKISWATAYEGSENTAAMQLRMQICGALVFHLFC